MLSGSGNVRTNCEDLHSPDHQTSLWKRCYLNLRWGGLRPAEGQLSGALRLALRTILPENRRNKVIISKRRERRENRASAEVVVMLSGLNGVSSPEWGSTDNVSARGARILTTRSWNPNDRVLIRSVEGNLQSRGRVVYRQRLHDNLFAIGVKLLAPRGRWGESYEALPRNVLAVAS
jgi:hypothetical protein